MTFGPTAAALQQLADASPASYIQKSEGVRTIRRLFECCKDARLSTGQAQTDVAALEAVFDVALRNGLGCLILDYVQEVCTSRFLVSSDPVDAALLDGSTIEQWCKAAIHRCRDRVLQQLNAGLLERHQQSAILQQESGCINALMLIARALQQPGMAQGGDMLAEAQRLKHLCWVLEWSATQQLLPKAGRFHSAADWRATVNKRMGAVHQVRPFLQDLLQGIAASDSPQGVASTIYPPESLGDFTQTLFLQGKTSQSTFRCKLALFLYCLLDRQSGAGGHKLKLESFREAFDLSRAEVQEWHCQFLLDDALTQSGSSSLQAACTILPGAASSSRGSHHTPTPFKFVQVLASLGRPDAALAVLRARAHVSSTDYQSSEEACQEAQTALSIRLQCGVFTEACSELRAYCGQPSHDKKGERTAVLVRQLADWAVGARQMHAVIRLPLGGLEEQILVDWFHQRMQSRHKVAYMLPMYYLQRGRIAEALHAYTTVKDGFQGSQGSAEEQEQQQQLEGLLESAARMLPAAQQGLATAPHQTQGEPALALTTTTAAGQGARSILGGIQNVQLADDQDIPTLLIRQHGKLPPPLLTSTLHHSNLFLPDAKLRKDNTPSAQGVAAATAVLSPKPSRLGRSALKPAGIPPTSSSLLTGRLNRQAKGRASLPSALGAAAGSPGTVPAASAQMDGGPVAVTTPAAATAASQGQEEAAQTPSQWTQEQWDTYMQGGSSAPTSTGKATGRKKAVRPVLKKQRMNTIVLD
ncbi:hypothetical protein WJX82_003376 [Trebouxia sp. C0006]